MALFKKRIKVEKLPKEHTAGLSAQLLNIKKFYVKGTTNLGAHVYHLVKFATFKAGNLIKHGVHYIFSKIRILCRKIGCSIKTYLSSQLSKVSSYFKGLAEAFTEKRNEKGIFPAVGMYISSLGKTTWEHRKSCITVFNYVAPVVCVVFFFNLISYASNIQYGISVEYNGKVIGYIANEAVFDQAQKAMQDRITYVDGDAAVTITPKLAVQKLESTSQVSDVDQLTDKLISNSNVDLTKAYGFYINNQFHGAVTDKTKIQETLDGILNKYKTNTAGETVEFVDKFEFKEGLYLSNGMVSPDSLIETLTSQKQVDSYYTVQAGDAPTSIAQKVGIPYATLKSLNPNIESRCMVGDQVKINAAQPYTSVRIKRVEEYDITLPYNTVSYNDATKYKGTQIVVNPGSTGAARVKAEVSYVNNAEQSRTILSQNVTKAAVDKQIAVGTKSTGASQQAINASGGSMLWPVGGNGGYISRGVSRYHTGIDIPIPYGTPIYAAADGVVTMSSWYSSYGKCVIINNGGGITTLYGHNSGLVASVGQSVKKGDLIAYAGSTGNSSGSHCHFEVRYNGVVQNPLSFVSQR